MVDADDKEIVRRVPIPKADLSVNFVIWPAGKPIHRIHSVAFSAAQFNPGKGSARFSPMSNGVPTLYGGVNTGVAVMETIFHDLPPHSSGTPYDLGKLHGLAYSVVKPSEDLQLVDLNPRTLRKIGVKRAELLDSTADQYVFTREYSLLMHQFFPSSQGLQWSSRQHGDSALMLFGDRVTREQLNIVIESERVLESATIMDEIEQQADQLGVVLID
ncbi:RES domain-containing protein [Serratia fonticola]|uniref:RES domain-containing protein n=1 Tax=Serratia fonticola TaxID=47917 RepID=A0A542D8I9_SERFO|nr:RES family NAD+ phosphorylase [Serratia fonticola]TQI78601.1 RES domain-containing protein [Serratia fonticola]TQI99377.1 RES domain-containing protein [Serratia fonticola]TVZ68901.1 RES domain-containing protein [Serratia fonticola]